MSLEYICLQEIAVNIFLNSDTFISIMSNFSPELSRQRCYLVPCYFDWSAIKVTGKWIGQENYVELGFYVLSSILMSCIFGFFFFNLTFQLLPNYECSRVWHNNACYITEMIMNKECAGGWVLNYCTKTVWCPGTLDLVSAYKPTTKQQKVGKCTEWWISCLNFYFVYLVPLVTI